MTRDKNQRSAYAMRRVSLAVDRLITSSDEVVRQHAKCWAKAWGKRANIRYASH